MEQQCNEKAEFNGTGFIGLILVIIFIALVLFGSTDLENLTNAP
ncbi:hypothetical protein [Salipaludibacillus keqinensis]|nr:hypothetical protein [Salipaludibacillus keqinensis]